jgi:hypothetical protein
MPRVVDVVSEKVFLFWNFLSANRYDLRESGDIPLRRPAETMEGSLMTVLALYVVGVYDPTRMFATSVELT